MDKREILQRIIDSDGLCRNLYTDYQPEMCAYCPMAKLKQRKDGTYLSCWDSLISTDNEIDVSDKIYLEKAIELLADIVMEDILREEPVAEETRRDSRQDS